MNSVEYGEVIEALTVLGDEYELGYPFEPDIESLDINDTADLAKIDEFEISDSWSFSTDGITTFTFTPTELMEWSRALPNIEFDDQEAAFITDMECCVCVHETSADHDAEFLNAFITNYKDKWELFLTNQSQLKVLGIGKYFLKNYRAKDIVQPELAVVVRSKDDECSKDELLGLAKSFIYELTTTHQIQLEAFSPCTVFDDWSGPDDGSPLDQVKKIRPLVRYSEAVQLYLDAEAAGSLDQRLLGYYKVLEHFGPPTSRMDSHEKLAHLLADPRALAPDSRILDEILEVNYDYKSARDQQLIRLVFGQCCSMHIMSDFPELESKYGGAMDKNTPRILADAYYATRNEVVHAKANYSSKGDEIPQEMRVQAVELIRRLADQAVRWGERQPSHIWASS